MQKNDAKTAISQPMSAKDAQDLYDRTKSRWEQLQQESLFSLKAAINSAELKIHSLTARVKEKESFLEKVERKNYHDPAEQNEDFVGLRVVTLFLSDLPKLDEIITSTFTLLSREDRVAGESAELFGYMSIQYVCQIPSQHAGPRYDGIKDLKFEIQARTILMDAWANVSHHLAYKGDASVPANLKRDFIALSGLFYVADQHFELFFRQALISQVSAQKAIEHDTAADLELNLETAVALLRSLYPDRVAANRIFVSEFVEEAAEVGITTVGDLKKALMGVRKQTYDYEEARPPGSRKGDKYLDVGMARNGMSIAHPEYDKILKKKAQLRHGKIRQNDPDNQA
jgi:putative GTP pyrophosphokinase